MVDKPTTRLVQLRTHQFNNSANLAYGFLVSTEFLLAGSMIFLVMSAKGEKVMIQRMSSITARAVTTVSDWVLENSIPFIPLILETR